MTDNLLPCPFCGSRLQWVDGPDNGLRMYLHSENGCAIEGQIFIVDHSDASKARLASWNSRAPSEGKEAVAWRIRHMNDGPHMWEYYPLSVVASPSENMISQHLTVRQLLDILNDDKHASAQERNPEPHAPSYLMQAFRDAWIMAGEMEGGWEDAYRLWRPPFAVDPSPETNMSPRDAVSYQQRQDAEYYSRARIGYDCTTGETSKPVLQRYAAKHSAATRKVLFDLIGTTLSQTTREAD